MSSGENINFFKSSSGIGSWLFTLDHKRIGIMYLIGVTSSLLLGGFFAMLLRLELFFPEQLFLTADGYNQMFTLHGVIMVFLFIIPAVPGVLGNFVLPLQLGAKDVAFPKLNLLSFYFWVVGLTLALTTIVIGGLDYGWTFYAPYSISNNTTVIIATLAAFILGFSSILTGLNFMATIHKMRAPGLTWFRLPLFIWALYATSVVQVVATPVIGATLLLLIIENVMHVGIFDASLGGDPILFQHFFWYYSHPAVYIMILPSFGVISEVITTFSRKRIFGYKAIAFSSLSIAFIGFLVWGHHMFVSGMSVVASTAFAFLTFFVGIPTAIKIFNWIATLYKGSIDFKTPLCYAYIFLVLFTIGGLTGLIMPVLSLTVHLHDTYFVVAHFHATMMGGAAVGFFCGLHYWWPKITGRMYNEFWGLFAATAIFVGFIITFTPQFFMGSLGMPRRYYTYVEEYQLYHQISTVGALIIGTGILMATFNLLVSLFNGKKAGQNPWGATTLEWTHAQTPPLHFNFEETPTVTDVPYNYDAETKT